MHRLGLLALLLLPGCGSDEASNTVANDPSVDTAGQSGIATPSEQSPQTAGESVESDQGTGASSKQSATHTVVPRFTDVAQELGVDFTFFADVVPDRFFLPEVMGGGAAWLDFDRDGQRDLYVANGTRLPFPDPVADDHVNRLYRQRDGRFVDVSIGCGADVGSYGQGVAVADWDVDGFPDLFVANFGQNHLLRNNGDGTFSDVSDALDDNRDAWSTSVAFFDVNRDSLPDLYVVNYLTVSHATHKICTHGDNRAYCGPGRFDGVDDRILVNTGDGGFVESSTSSGFQVEPEGKGLAITVADFDGDLHPEIYVANDMAPNSLYALDDDRWRDVAVESGCATSLDGRLEASMGIACADFDGDALIDVFLTHYFQMKNTLYRNRGGLLFDDVSRRTRVAAASIKYLGFGTCPIDFDGDADWDLFIANGHVLGPLQSPNEMTSQLLENDGRGRFTDVSSAAGEYFLEEVIGRGVAAADYDDDGDLDLVVTHVGRPMALLRNDTETNGTFIGVQLSHRSRVHPVGARVEVSWDDRKSIQSVTAGGSYLCQADERLLFALPQATTKVDITVHWPDGSVSRWDDLSTGLYWALDSGGRSTNMRTLQTSDVAPDAAEVDSPVVCVARVACGIQPPPGDFKQLLSLGQPTVYACFHSPPGRVGRAAAGEGQTLPEPTARPSRWEGEIRDVQRLKSCTATGRVNASNREFIDSQNSVGTIPTGRHDRISAGGNRPYDRVRYLENQEAHHSRFPGWTISEAAP